MKVLRRSLTLSCDGLALCVGDEGETADHQQMQVLQQRWEAETAAVEALIRKTIKVLDILIQVFSYRTCYDRLETKHCRKRNQILCSSEISYVIAQKRPNGRKCKKGHNEKKHF